MVEPSNSADAGAAPVCPWCSAPLSAADADTCPSCGAALKGEVAEQLPGLTAIDADAIVRAKKPPKPRSRLLSWLSGETDDETFRPGDAKAVAFPDLDVRREMLKLEIEADLANLQAEADAILSDAAASGRRLNIPPELAEAAGLTSLGAEGPEGDAAEPGDAEPVAVIDDAEAEKPV
jgi:hypothetical protein